GRKRPARGPAGRQPHGPGRRWSRTELPSFQPRILVDARSGPAYSRIAGVVRRDRIYRRVTLCAEAYVMSRLVMLPNARRVPEFLPVSPGKNLSACRGAYRECQNCRRLRSKSPEARYLAALRGIITGPSPVVPKQHTGYGSGRRLGGGPGRLARLQMPTGPP